MSTRVVHKYVFDVQNRENEMKVTVPDGSRVVAFQVQQGRPCFWMEKCLDVPLLVDRRYVLVGTGHPVEPGL